MSLRENEYSRIVQRIPDEELRHIATNYEVYTDPMLLAVKWEFEARGIPLPAGFPEITEIEEKPESVTVFPETKQADEHPDVIVPPMYSRSAILGFSLFFSPITGGILLAINAAKISKKYVLPILLFAISYTALQVYASLKIPKGNFLGLLVPVAGALLLSDVLWNMYIGRKVKYKNRSILVPLIISIIIFAPLIYLVYYYPEFLNLSVENETK
jgi:hypothetical protein